MFDFQKLSVYQKSKTFHLLCKQILLNNSFEKYVSDQLRRASHSIILNIAEGSAKSSKADRSKFFTIARGSVFECVAIVDILQMEESIDQNTYTILLDTADEISKLLYAMVRNLSR